MRCTRTPSDVDGGLGLALEQVLRLGFNLIYTDTDVVFLRDPRADLAVRGRAFELLIQARGEPGQPRAEPAKGKTARTVGGV